MTGYLIRRSLQAVPLLIAISVIVFALLQMTPGGPLSAGEGADSQASSAQLAALRAKYGLDDPLPLQYLRWAGGVVTGDWGSSFSTGLPVLTMIGERVPATLMLTVSALVISLVLALGLGIVAAVRHRTFVDVAATTFSFAGLATPSFWLAMMLLFVFSYQLRWLPASGLRDLRANSTGFAAFADTALHLVLPVTVLVIVAVAGLARYVRAALLDELALDYVRTARGNALPERVVIMGHALKNAAIPIVTIAVLALPDLFLGAVIVETIFGLPGMGSLFIESATVRDYPVLLGILLIAAALVVIANLAADLIYARLDPRVRLG